MAMQTETPSTTPSVQVVGNAFVDQYYHILHHSPELVYKFYQDKSVASRPDHDGVMTSVTTMQGINEKICSLDYTNYKAEIKTADAQESYNDGVIVLVTGCLTGKDNVRRKFTQTFFLAPQDKGYFVNNDIFRYMEESEAVEVSNTMVEGVDAIQSASLIAEPDPAEVIDPSMPDQATSNEEDVLIAEEEAHKPLANERQLANKNIVPVAEHHPSENHMSAVTESSSTSQEDTLKMSYASIVSSQTKKGISGPTKVYVPANTSRAVPTKTEKLPVPQPPAGEARVPISPQSSDGQDEGEGHSIYIRNLPMNSTILQLEGEFKKFGPIKERGIQIRYNKQGFCFGFVEFQESSSMHNAIQASPVIIGGKEAVVEMKRTTTRVGSARGRFPSGPGLFRNDSFRGRGNFSGGRGYGRSDYGVRGEYSGRGRGSGGRGGDSFRQPGRGRGGRGGGPSQYAIAP